MAGLPTEARRRHEGLYDTHTETPSRALLRQRSAAPQREPTALWRTYVTKEENTRPTTTELGTAITFPLL